MAAAAVSDPRLTARSVYAVGTHRPRTLPPSVEWQKGAHPLPDGRSVVAARRVREIARGVAPDEGMLLLLSGGASSLLALPADGISLDDKRRTIAELMRSGADIHALNTVRKHLSSIKGGQLARECRGPITTLAVSDVVGDDLSVIGSGPGVADQSSWADAARALELLGTVIPDPVRDLIAAGVRGERDDTPKPGGPGMEQATGRVIASRRDALDGARQEAESRGYQVEILWEPVIGDARSAAGHWYSEVEKAMKGTREGLCLVSGGETTVHVVGKGRGGRNQEFALALVGRLADSARDLAIASIGTDGIDGPTDAAGAFVDSTTLKRALELGLGDPRGYLDENDSYSFFDAVGDLIHTGRTDTNVGDLQVVLAGAI